MDTGLLIIVIFAVIILLIYFISRSNKMERLCVKVKEADSGIDVALTKRYDVLTKLMDTVREYTDYEQDTLLKVLKLRKNMTMQEKVEAERRLSEAANQIRMLAEAYPALGAQAVFVQLQNAAIDSEENLQAARRLYNSNVSILNQLIVSFPASVVAAIKGLSQLPMFEAEDYKRADVSLRR